MKCGFIGLGSQGGPMARRIVEAGFELVLWARRPESLAPFADTAATYASDVAELGRQVEFCGVCVVDDNGVKEVVGQLLPVMSGGSIIAIHSTVAPSLCIALAEQAAAKGIILIDAPVSGGGQAAEAGELTVMIGGDRSAPDRLRAVFETYSSTVIYLGEVGAGQFAKLVNNTMMAANLAIADHSLSVAKALGLEPDAFIELVKISSGRSFAFDVRARMGDAGDFSHGARLLEKDVGLLGESLKKDNASYAAMRDTANQFLTVALNK